MYRRSMKAICRTKDFGVESRDLEIPEPETEHLIIRVSACAINPGDLLWIAGGLSKSPRSLYDICGVSGAGIVVEIGKKVPAEFGGKKVAFYRSIKATEYLVGTWCEFARLHYLNCIVLPDDAKLEDYSGTLVNSISPYAFMRQIDQTEHKAVICTAGTSATGRALLGVCLSKDFPVLSIVRKEIGKEALGKLGGKFILSQSDPDFEIEFKRLAEELRATAVFDGVGGDLINKLVNILPFGSTVYAYGFLGGDKPLGFPTKVLQMNALTLTYFSISRSPVVLDPQALRSSLIDLRKIIDRPHFKTEIGKKYKMEEINEALQYSSNSGDKAVIFF